MKIRDIVYVVDPFLMEVRRCKIVGEEVIGVFLDKKNQPFWKIKDSTDGSINFSYKETTFVTIEEANKYIELLLNTKLKVLKKKTNTKEKLINYLYELAMVSEVDNHALEYLEAEIYKHTDVNVGD